MDPASRRRVKNPKHERKATKSHKAQFAKASGKGAATPRAGIRTKGVGTGKPKIGRIHAESRPVPQAPARQARTVGAEAKEISGGKRRRRMGNKSTTTQDPLRAAAATPSKETPRGRRVEAGTPDLPEHLDLPPAASGRAAHGKRVEAEGVDLPPASRRTDMAHRISVEASPELPATDPAARKPKPKVVLQAEITSHTAGAARPTVPRGLPGAASNPSTPKGTTHASTAPSKAPPGTSAPSWERHVTRRPGAPVRDFDLDGMTDDELVACSKALGIRLSLDEMKAARAYFHGKRRKPTDVEMEALGQAWSEHCCYKSSKPVLARHVYGIAEDKIVCREDAGVLPFDGDWYYVPKLESHNHPSAIEPYGGAATGIGGVIRDVLCMGAQPVALVDPLFFGPLDASLGSIPAGVKHPRFLLQGVIQGIRDYGNRVGIPTVAGSINFHPGYTGNCLVNVGCVGIMHKSMLTHSRAGGVGDVFVYLGNPTGRDGIHGVAFASEELSEASEEASRSAVQVGDAILKEPLIHVTLEILEKKLATGCKDFGGGGLSCVCGELAYDAGFGCEIQLDQVPLKSSTMAPWEVWVSESQERMMVTCKPSDVEKVLHIAKKWDVPAAAVGKVIKEPVNRVWWKGEKVLEFDLKFSTGGPVYNRPMAPSPKRPGVPGDFPAPKDLGEMLLRLLAHPNIMSKEWVIRQYDHEVRANTVLKPLQGVIGKAGPGDASVLKPVRASDKGLAITTAINPNFTSRDAYWGAASAIDELVRNLAAVGARADSILDNLNMGNPEKPERMREIEDSTKGLGDMARALQLPFASGNVSLYNEGPTGAVPPTPTCMGIGILSHFKHATTMDLKEAGNALYLVGATKREFGGSVYALALGVDGETVPTTEPKTLKASAEAVVSAIEHGLVRSAHDCSEGGIAVALAEMAFAGDLGARIDVSHVGAGLRGDMKLFSESNTRWILEAPAAKAKAFEAHMRAAATPLVRLGDVTKERRVIAMDGNTRLIDVGIEECRAAWRDAMPKLMGVTA